MNSESNNASVGVGSAPFVPGATSQHRSVKVFSISLEPEDAVKNVQNDQNMVSIAETTTEQTETMRPPTTQFFPNNFSVESQDVPVENIKETMPAPKKKSKKSQLRQQWAQGTTQMPQYSQSNQPYPLPPQQYHNQVYQQNMQVTHPNNRQMQMVKSSRASVPLAPHEEDAFDNWTRANANVSQVIRDKEKRVHDMEQAYTTMANQLNHTLETHAENNAKLVKLEENSVEFGLTYVLHMRF
jgi:hypothetical protein